MKNEIGDNLNRQIDRLTDRQIVKYRLLYFLEHNIFKSFYHNIRFLIRKPSNKKNFFNNIAIVSSFLCNGNYLFNGYIIKRTHKKSGADIFPVQNAVSDKKTYVSGKVIFGEWTEKMIIIFDDIVINYYPETHIKWIENIVKFYDLCNYSKKCMLKEINLEQRYIIYSKSFGKIADNAEKIIYFCTDILNFNIVAEKYNFSNYGKRLMDKLKKIGIDDFVSYVQHGDAVLCNLLWDGFNYEMIDFDLMGIYPALYDLLSCLTYGKVSIFGLPLYISGYFNDLLLRLFNISDDMLEFYKDKYLAIFFVFNEQRLVRNLKLLKKILPKSYSKSWLLLNY